MMLRMCSSKIHRATVTQSDLDYEGPIPGPNMPPA